MPKAKTPAGVKKSDKAATQEQAQQPDDGMIIPRVSLGEKGLLGLKTANGKIYEEVQAAFRFPAMLTTVAQMRNNPTVGSAVNVYRMMMSRIPWDVEASASASEVDKQRAAIVRTMMDDMEHSWAVFIESVIPYLEYGFGINEKVMRRRLKRNGSKFDDGLVGLKKLPTRSQDTIASWLFSEDGADLVGVEQSLQWIENPQRFQNRTNEKGLIEIPREKFLLFSASANKGNPEGNSIYKNIFLSFKQLSMLLDQELLTIAKDMSGALKIEIPPQYLSPEATPEQQAVVKMFKDIVDKYSAGEQRGLLVPRVIDPETKQELFKYDILESKSQAKVDIEAVVKRTQSDILSALSVDVLKLGSDGSGSFSLADAKTSILALAIDYRMREIADVLNSDLMPTIYAMNGWDQTNMAKFVYKDIEEVDLESYSKAIQRIFSTSAIEVDRPVLNKIREAMKFPLKPDDEPVDKENLPAVLTGQQSSSGKGMEVGTTGEGTAKNGTNGKDRSGSNVENTG
jgi:hypothetical protein